MRTYLLLIGVAFITSYLLTPVLRAVGARFLPEGPMRQRDMHKRPTPKLGGVAIIGAIYLCLAMATRHPFFVGILKNPEPIQGVAIALAVVLVLGVLDDLMDLKWWIKLIGQTSIGLIIAGHGIVIKALPIGSVNFESQTTRVAVTVILIVLIMNAINFMDGLDGLAAGVSAIGAATFFAYSYYLAMRVNAEDYSNLSALLCAILLGATLGFLPHNFNPASIFMGESGVLAIGLLLAVSSIAVTGDVLGEDAFRFRNVPAYMPVILPAAVIMLPLLDLGLSVIRRMSRGQSPFHADQGHMHHRMVQGGHSEQTTVILMYLWAALCASGVMAFSLLNRNIVVPIYVAALISVGFATWWPKIRHGYAQLKAGREK